MNRKNLTAAVLAGLAGAAGIVGSAQASFFPNDIVLNHVHAIQSTSQPADMDDQVFSFDNATAGDMFAREVIQDNVLAITSDEVIVGEENCATGRVDAIVLVTAVDMDSMSKGDIVPTDIVFSTALQARGEVQRWTPDINHFTQARTS